MLVRAVPMLAVAIAVAAAVAACGGATGPSVMATPAPTPIALPSQALAATPEPPTIPPASATLAPGATPGPTQLDLLPLLTSEITVVNLEDQVLTLTVAIIDPDSTDEFEVARVDLQPLQVTTQAVIPARLRLTFEFAGSSTPAGTCTIDVADGEQLQFAAVAGGVAITTAGQEPATPADLLVATAARCHAGASS